MKSFVTHTTARLTAYRFGYTGHEKEGDLAEGVYTTQYRLLDTRLGRWMSVDPQYAKYSGLSPYNYAANIPTIMNDPDGDVVVNSSGNLRGNDGNHQYGSNPDATVDGIMLTTTSPHKKKADGSIDESEIDFSAGFIYPDVIGYARQKGQIHFAYPYYQFGGKTEKKEEFDMRCPHNTGEILPGKH